MGRTPVTSRRPRSAGRSGITHLPTVNCGFVGVPEPPLQAPVGTPVPVLGWVAQVAALTEPARICWCDEQTSVAWDGRSGLLEDAALLEGRRFRCAGDLGDGDQAVVLRQELCRAFAGVMEGRTMYVLPFRDRDGERGIQITDSPGIAAALLRSVEVGDPAALGSGRWLAAVHAVGVPGDRWRAPTLPMVCQFAASRELWAIGTTTSGHLPIPLGAVSCQPSCPAPIARPA